MHNRVPIVGVGASLPLSIDFPSLLFRFCSSPSTQALLSLGYWRTGIHEKHRFRLPGVGLGWGVCGGGEVPAFVTGNREIP